MRFIGLGLGMICLILNGVLTLTPMAWDAMGRPDETYPEMVYGTFGLPIAFWLSVFGAVFAYGGTSTLKHKLFHCSQWAVCILLIVLSLSPWWMKVQ